MVRVRDSVFCPIMHKQIITPYGPIWAHSKPSHKYMTNYVEVPTLYALNRNVKYDVIIICA